MTKTISGINMTASKNLKPIRTRKIKNKKRRNSNKNTSFKTNQKPLPDANPIGSV